MHRKEKFILILNKIIEYCFYGLIFFIPISIACVEIFSTIIIFSFFIKKFIKPDFKFLKDRTFYFLFLFAMFSTLSLFNSGIYFKKSLEALFFKWFEYIIIFLAIKDVIEPYRAKKLIFVILLFAILIGIDGIFQRVFNFDFIRGRKTVEIPITNSSRVITGPFKHYNSFGAYLVIVLSLSFALLLEDKKRLSKIFFLFLTILLVLCLLFTFSRGAWVGFLFSGFLILFLSKKRRFIFLVLFFVFMLIFIPVFRERLTFMFRSTGDAGRFELWKTTLLMISENPFLGKGIGTFMDYLPFYNYNLGHQYAHNSFLQILAETGIFSLIFFVLFIVSIIFRCIKGFLKNKDYTSLGIGSAIFGFCIHSFFDNQFYSLQLSVLFWIMLGLGVVVCLNKNSN